MSVGYNFVQRFWLLMPDVQIGNIYFGFCHKKCIATEKIRIPLNGSLILQFNFGKF